MVKYSKVNVKLTDTQLKKLKAAVKNKTGTTLRLSFKMFDRNNLPHELLLTTRKKTKLRNAFNKNMSTDLQLSKAEIFKVIQSVGFLGSLLSKLAGPLKKVVVLLAKKCFTCIRNYICFFSNSCRNSKGNASFRDNYFNNFKQRNE